MTRAFNPVARCVYVLWYLWEFLILGYTMSKKSKFHNSLCTLNMVWLPTKVESVCDTHTHTLIHTHTHTHTCARTHIHTGPMFHEAMLTENFEAQLIIFYHFF